MQGFIILTDMGMLIPDGLLIREINIFYGHPERFIFGFEESYGYLSGTHVRDKDGVNAVLLICEAAAWYARKGMTLGDAPHRNAEIT